MIGVKKDINLLLELLIKDLASQVSEQVISTVEGHFANKNIDASKSPKSLITSLELAKQLCVSVSTIVAMRKNGLPFFRIGDSIRFDSKEVMQYVINNHKNKEHGQN